eukprot:scaffold12683_cov144-Skeletonema_dohrnii-CCMP3373.AAC.6
MARFAITSHLTSMVYIFCIVPTFSQCCHQRCLQYHLNGIFLSVERKRCNFVNCTNYAQNGGVCKRHGAKKKACSVDDCTNQSISGGVCVRHGAKVEYKLCSVEGCASKAQKGGVCWRHGAKVCKLCSVEGCTNQVVKGGLCIRHGAQKKRCSVDGCTNQRRRRGVCTRHGAYSAAPDRKEWGTNQAVRGGVRKRHGAKAEYKLCSFGDCTNKAQKGGICIKHGAKVKRCSVVECNNKAQKGGVCRRHGAKVKRCSSEGCTNRIQRRGVCRRHGAYSNIAPPPAQANFLCGEVQGGGNQNNVSTVVEISDNEGEGGEKQSPIAGRKRKAGVGKKSETAASDDTEEDGPVRERSKEPTRRSTRLSTVSKPNYNEDAAYTELEGNVDGNEEGEEPADRAPSEDNEQVQLDQKRSQPETSCEGRPVTALERDVLSEEDQRQDAHAGSTRRLRINSNEDNVVAVKDNEASAMAPGVDQQARSQEDPVDGNDVETEQCDDRWDGANQDKDDDEEVETQDTMVLSERDSGEIDMPKQAGNDDGDESNEMVSEIDHQARLLVDPADANEVETEQDQDDDTWNVADQQAVYSPAEDDEESGTQQETPLSQRDSGEIDVPKQVELHQATVPESERMVSESKEEQLQQTEERYSALGKAAKLRDTTESKLRSDLAKQVKITANLQAQLDQATVENRRLQEQKSRAKSVEEELARSAIQVQAQRDEISRLNSENEDMKGRHEDALAKEVAEKNRLQAKLESLRAQNDSSSEAKGTSPASSSSQPDIATFARSYETRSQSRQRQSGRGSIATDQTYPKRRTSPRGGNKSDSNMKSSLETISEGSGASVGEPTRKKIAELKKRTATRSQNGEKLPHGLEKELVRKINNEIVVRGQEVTFDDIAGLEDAKNTVKEMVIYPMKRPDLFTGLRSCPKGLLLFGPPGTGKTMIGKAIAHESGATFFSISASSLKSKWIGEGEKLVKTLFAVASYQSPSVVFIDEVDSMLTQRKSDEDEASRSMKNEFLVQLDGAGNETKGHVLVIGATNLPHELDDAARRRFVKRLYIPLPDRAVREQQLRTLLANSRHSLKDNEIIKLSHATDGYSCADLKNLCTDASMGPMRSLTLTVEDLMRINADEVPPISYRHFRRSLRGMNPSVAQSDLQVHLDWNDKYGSKVTNDLDDDDDDYDSSDDENECCTPADAKQLSKIAGLDGMV